MFRNSVFFRSLLILVALAKLQHSTTALADEQTELMGTYCVTSAYNKYLQAKSGPGQLHASQDSCGMEETWYLFKITATGGDKSYVAYSLQNAESQKYLVDHSRIDGEQNCPEASDQLPGDALQLFDIVYPSNGDTSLAAVQFLSDNYYFFSNEPGNDDYCKGEVYTRQGTNPSPSNPNEVGYFWHFNKVSSSKLLMWKSPKPSAKQP